MTPLWLGLASAARRELAQAMFPSFWERGLSASQAIKALREQGLGYRYQDFLRDYAQGFSRYTQATRIRFVSPDKIPSEDILQEQYFGVPDRYSFKIRYEGTDINTGERVTGYFFYHTDVITTRGELESTALMYMGEHKDLYPVDIDEITLYEGYINPVWG